MPKIGSRFILMLLLSFPGMGTAQGSTVDRSLEASVLGQGYALRLLKPLPRRNSGCETIFRSGEVLETCDPNYGVDPAIDGVVRNYCEWNLNTHWQKYNSSKWLEPYFNADLISIVDAKVGFIHHDPYRTVLHQLQDKEYINYRWIEIRFQDRLTGSNLGSLKCYPSQAYEYDPRRQDLYGEYFYHYDESAAENKKKIKSGVTIGMILDQLKGYAEIIRL